MQRFKASPLDHFVPFQHPDQNIEFGPMCILSRSFPRYSIPHKWCLELQDWSLAHQSRLSRAFGGTFTIGLHIRRRHRRRVREVRVAGSPSISSCLLSTRLHMGFTVWLPGLYNTNCHGICSPPVAATRRTSSWSIVTQNLLQAIRPLHLLVSKTFAWQ